VVFRLVGLGFSISGTVDGQEWECHHGQGGTFGKTEPLEEAPILDQGVGDEAAKRDEYTFDANSGSQ